MINCMRNGVGSMMTWATTAAAAGFSSISRSQGESRALPAEDITVPTFNAPPAASEVDLKPDLEATAFSAQNAFYFAKMSKVVYLPKDEVQGVIQGNATSEGLGFDHFYWFEADPAVSSESVLDAVQDTEAFVAANDDMIMLVFRGTKEATDWFTNLRFFAKDIPKSWGLSDGAHLHRGFDDGVDTVWTDCGMHETIKKLYHEEGKNRKLYIAGHSLGGALATVAAARLVFTDNMNITAIYTIGSPRVFDGTLAALFNNKDNFGKTLKEKYFRCRNNNDIVPRIVPPPYVHVGTEIYLDRFGMIGTTSLVDRLLGRLSAMLRFSFIEDINDHSASEYIRLFKQVVIDSRVSLFEKTKSIVTDAAQKVIPINKEKKKAQEQAIEAAKAAAVEASKETPHPANLKEYATEEEELEQARA